MLFRSTRHSADIHFICMDSFRLNKDLMYRFKTGTPARIDKNSIDFTKMEEQKGDERVVPFSFTTDPEDVQIDQVSCWSSRFKSIHLNSK